MRLSNITWTGPEIDDKETLVSIPGELQSILSINNGFILSHGALHVRGLCKEPYWHSLREAWSGEHSFSTLYPEVLSSDIPFAQDQVGDQYLLRGSTVIHLDSEVGGIDEFASSLTEFFNNVESNIEEYLNVSLSHQLEPGQLLHAYPPFCIQADKEVSLRPCPAQEIILFHARFADETRDVPDRGKIKIKLTD